MSGKAALLLVISFFAIFAGFSIRNVSVVNSTFDKMTAYEAQNNAYNIAVAGANVAFSRLNQLLPKPPIIDEDIHLPNRNFNGGYFNVSCTHVSGSVYRLTSIGTYSTNGKDYTARVVVTYQPGGWGRFAYYSENEGASTIWWSGNDVIEGPFHTQSSVLHVMNHPRFKGEASIKGSGTGVLDYKNSKTADYPDFQSGFFTNVDLPMRTDSMDSTKAAAGKPEAWLISGHPLVYLTFNGNQVKYKWSRTGTETTGNINTLAPNGVICVANGDVHIKGVLDGQVTILCLDNQSKSDQGNIWLDNDITLSDNPRTNPNSNDFLGLVAQDKVIITYTDEAGNKYNHDGINIDAAIFCANDGFGAQSYDTRTIDGSINLFGGIVQKSRNTVCTYGSSGAVNHGFAKNYRYDPRFETKWPPFYPCGKGYRVMAWYDGVGSSTN